MAEFLSQDEIDALLDIADQGEDINNGTSRKNSEIMNFSSDLVDNIQKKNRVQVILECSKIINYVDSILKEYNLNISDLLIYSYKSKENEFYIKNKDIKLCYSLKELEDPAIFQESLDVLNRLEVDITTGDIKIKG